MRALTMIFALFLSFSAAASVQVDSLAPCVIWKGDVLGFDTLRVLADIPAGAVKYDTITFYMHRDSAGTVIDTFDVYELTLITDIDSIRIREGECITQFEGELFRADAELFAEFEVAYLSVPTIYSESGTIPDGTVAATEGAFALGSASNGFLLNAGGFTSLLDKTFPSPMSGVSVSVADTTVSIWSKQNLGSPGDVWTNIGGAAGTWAPPAGGGGSAYNLVDTTVYSSDTLNVVFGEAKLFNRHVNSNGIKVLIPSGAQPGDVFWLTTGGYVGVNYSMIIQFSQSGYKFCSEDTNLSFAALFDRSTFGFQYVNATVGWVQIAGGPWALSAP